GPVAESSLPGDAMPVILNVPSLPIAAPVRERKPGPSLILNCENLAMTDGSLAPSSTATPLILPAGLAALSSPSTSSFDTSNPLSSLYQGDSALVLRLIEYLPGGSSLIVKLPFASVWPYSCIQSFKDALSCGLDWSAS